MIQRLLLRDLRLLESVTYLNRVCAIGSESPVAPALADELSLLQRITDELLAGLRPLGTKEHTRQLKAHDRLRCRMAGCLFKLAEAFREVPDAGYRAAAAVVKRLLKQCGSTKKLSECSMSTRSVLLNAVLQRYRGEDAIAGAVQQLPGARISMEALEEAQHAFLVTQEDRLRYQANSKRGYTGAQKRAEAARCLNNLLDLIDAQVLLTGSDDWKTLARRLHSTNKRMAHNLAIRAGKRRARKAKAATKAIVPQAAPAPEAARTDA
ncbi:MAG: hypothetical protein EOO11_09755 [Chitinophagaceae bacterium]|nr:MAG: hypothetical protein EOO11_09755 [Chitinophagaceae bacterium]